MRTPTTMRLVFSDAIFAKDICCKDISIVALLVLLSRRSSNERYHICKCNLCSDKLQYINIVKQHVCTM